MMTFTIVALFILLVFAIHFRYMAKHGFAGNVEMICEEISLVMSRIGKTCDSFVNAMMRRKRRRLKVKRGAVF